MSRATPPIIGRIPGEIHAEARALGLIVETYTEVISGHGPSGRVAWTIGVTREFQGWTDTISLRSGTASTHEHARADMRHALADIRSTRVDHLAEVRAAHVHLPSGYCRCGLTPVLTSAEHEQHLTDIIDII